MKEEKREYLDFLNDIICILEEKGWTQIAKVILEDKRIDKYFADEIKQKQVIEQKDTQEEEKEEETQEKEEETQEKKKKRRKVTFGC